MKKQLALLLSLFFVMATQAQNETKERKLRLGFLGTSSYGWMSTDSKNLSGGGLKAGVGFGIYGDYFFAENYAFSIEALHSTQGYKLKVDSICTFYKPTSEYKKTGGAVINYQMRSFQLPITLKLRTNEIGYWRYFGQIGIAPSFTYRSIKGNYDPNVFAREDDNIDRLVNDQENDFIYAGDAQIEDINRDDFLEEDNVSGFRLPLIIGAGGEWNVSGNTAIVMGIRYEYGLLNMMKAENSVARRNVFSLVAGVRF